MQIQAQVAYRERSLYYAANMINGQIEAGQDYRQLRKTIHISLTDFILFPGDEELSQPLEKDLGEFVMELAPQTTKHQRHLETCWSSITSRSPSFTRLISRNCEVPSNVGCTFYVNESTTRESPNFLNFCNKKKG